MELASKARATSLGISVKRSEMDLSISLESHSFKTAEMKVLLTGGGTSASGTQSKLTREMKSFVVKSFGWQSMSVNIAKDSNILISRMIERMSSEFREPLETFAKMPLSSIVRYSCGW